MKKLFGQDGVDQFIDEIISTSLVSFTDWIFDKNWKGRESEAISLYCFCCLAPRFGNNEIFKNQIQICIEGTVPGVPGINPKGRVQKDLVIWPPEVYTCWNDEWKVTNYPLSIIEWKVFREIHRKPKISEYDINWLKEFSKLSDNFVGYAVALDLADREFKINVTRVYKDTIDYNWLNK